LPEYVNRLQLLNALKKATATFDPGAFTSRLLFVIMSIAQPAYVGAG
jgi:hypothetical protein